MRSDLTGIRERMAGIPILSVSVSQESDVVAARQRARQIAALLGFDVHQQTKLATAVSEIARNAYNYGNGGRADFSIEVKSDSQRLVIRITDSGSGIADLARVLEGNYESETGMGLGIIGARRLMDSFEIESSPGAGVAVTMSKELPGRAPLVTKRTLGHLIDELARQEPAGPLVEMRQQNRELLATLEELGSRQEELLRLNHELEDTNRGVVALYAELDDKAEHLRRADDMKSRFLSNMSHEFRTPLNSILALTRLLLDRADGELTGEQERQVFFIRKSAESLYELINDLLDLAKVESGKTTVHPAEFDVKNLFGALRGMLKPLLVNPAVNLVFEEPDGLPPVISDEAKISQILRNFVSNALKFTERGEVRVSARRNGDRVIFSVSDTGIGIDATDVERIFQEFTQLESPIQRKVKGTGLGLPLSRKLAELLGGSVSVQSTPGTGSTFSLEVPAGTAAADEPDVISWEAEGKVPVLLVQDHDENATTYEEFLKDSRYHLIRTRSAAEALTVLEKVRARAILLDVAGENGAGSRQLAELRASNLTTGIPVLAVTVMDEPHAVYGPGAEIYTSRPFSGKWLQETLDRYVGERAEAHRILLVDDDPTFRYLLRQIFSGMPHEFIEAETGLAGLEQAMLRRPELIFLDLMMPKMTGYELLERLRGDPKTRDIPVIVVSSRFLSDSDLRKLKGWGAETLSKDRFGHADFIPTVRGILDGFGLVDLLPSNGQSAG